MLQHLSILASCLSKANSGDIKWTDIGTFLATAIQTTVVILAFVVAYYQYRSSVRDTRTERTLRCFADFARERPAIESISGHIDFEQDWDVISEQLRKPSDDSERLACEQQLFAIANLFSELALLYRTHLLDRRLLLDEYDEYVLFICGAVSGVYKQFPQPDYRGLFELARYSQVDYRKKGARYSNLADLSIPQDESGFLPAQLA